MSLSELFFSCKAELSLSSDDLSYSYSELMQILAADTGQAGKHRTKNMETMVVSTNSEILSHM